jgi:flagellar motor switch/type III secretory pathway protein FliN
MKEEATAKALPTLDAKNNWSQVQKLACEFTVDVPFPRFKIADALSLGRQTVLNSLWRVGKDVPLRVNGELIAYGEFEVVGERLAVRLTELA